MPQTVAMLRIQIRFRAGEIVGGESATAKGAQAVCEVLASRCGQFDLVPGDPWEGSPLAESFDYLLLEGCRRLDQQYRGS